MFPAELTVLQKQQQGQELANKMFSLENRDAISFWLGLVLWRGAFGEC